MDTANRSIPAAVLGLLLFVSSLAAATLEGRVLGAASSWPQPGVRVELVGDAAGAVLSGADGRFLLEGPEKGPVSLKLSKAGFLDILLDDVAVDDGGRRSLGDLEIASLASATEADSLARRGSLAGRVVDAVSGNGLDGVLVTVLGLQGPSQTRRTGDGRFVLDGLQPGKGWLCLDRPGYLSLDSLAVEVQAGTLVSLGVLEVEARPAESKNADAADGGERVESPSVAGKGKICGRVLGADDGAPLVGANLRVVGSQPARGAATDLNGSFLIPQVAIGRYDVEVASVGYRTLTVAEVMVSRDLNTDLGVIEMTPSGVELTEVVIVAERKQIKLDKASQTLAVTAEDVSRTAVSDVADIVARTPGFKVDDQGMLHGRGGRADETLLLLDGSLSHDPLVGHWASPGSTRPVRPDPFSGEDYGRLVETGYSQTARTPLSTFAAEADGAAWANLRRFLEQDRLPPKDAVRVEECLNAFDYADAPPEGDAPLAIHAEYTDCPWNAEHGLVRVALQGKRIAREDQRPAALTFLLDVSGSMSADNKLPLIQRAFRLLVEELRPEDRVAIVVYAGASGLVLRPTPGDCKAEILAALDRLRAGGGTAGGAGLRLAYSVAREHFREGGSNRVILATDGDFNLGVADTGELTRFLEEQRAAGVFLTVIGVGGGNYKESRLQEFAARGDGQLAYFDDLMEARRVLVTQIGGTLETIAKDVKIQVEFNPAVIAEYRLVGYENRRLRTEDFEDDAKDAGEIGSGHHVTALYEVVPAAVDADGDAGLRYQRSELSREGRSQDEAAYVKVRWKAPEGGASREIVATLPARRRPLAKASEDARWSAAIAGFSQLLGDSEHKGTADCAALRELGQSARGADLDGRRAEALRLMERGGLLLAEVR